MCVCAAAACVQVGQIENEYRVFDMEVLAGEKEFEAEVSQHGTRFRLDLSKVRGGTVQGGGGTCGHDVWQPYSEAGAIRGNMLLPCAVRSECHSMAQVSSSTLQRGAWGPSLVQAQHDTRFRLDFSKVRGSRVQMGKVWPKDVRRLWFG